MLRKRVEERNLQHLVPKKRARINTASKKTNNNIVNKDQIVTKSKSSLIKNTKNGKLMKKRSKNVNDISSVSSSSNDDDDDDDDDNDIDDDTSSNSSSSCRDSDDSSSEVERDYDMSAVSEYIWLIGKVHMDSEDKRLYITTRVEIDRNDYIVAYRQPVNQKGQPVGKESKNSYHVADIADYTRKSTHLVATSSSSSSSSCSLSQPSLVDAMTVNIVFCN